MGHNITALLLRGDIQPDAVKQWDLMIESLPFDLKLAYIDHYYTACWQKMKNLEEHLPLSAEAPAIFPTDLVLFHIAKELKDEGAPIFGVIFTDYFGGVGMQFAQMYRGTELLDPTIVTINQALSNFGVRAYRQLDEFDSVGLTKYRHNPDYLEKYWDLADELDV